MDADLEFNVATESAAAPVAGCDGRHVVAGPLVPHPERTLGLVNVNVNVNVNRNVNVNGNVNVNVYVVVHVPVVNKRTGPY
jgi:hypothetical protein